MTANRESGVAADVALSRNPKAGPRDISKDLAMRSAVQALGTAVFYGMIGVTLFGIFLTPATMMRSLGSTRAALGDGECREHRQARGDKSRLLDLRLDEILQRLARVAIASRELTGQRYEAKRELLVEAVEAAYVGQHDDADAGALVR